MKKAVVILLASVAFLCSSCTAYRYTARQVAVENHDIVASPTIVDVAVDYTKRISETSHRCKSVAEALQEAKYKAITNNDIDIIVDMIYKTEKPEEFGLFHQEDASYCIEHLTNRSMGLRCNEARLLFRKF